jgi:hypothetical protein
MLEQNSVERLTRRARPAPVSFFDRRYLNTFNMTCYIGSKLISCLLACFCIGAKIFSGDLTTCTNSASNR